MVNWFLASNDYGLGIFFVIMAALGLLLSIGKFFRSRDARGLKKIVNMMVHGLVLVWTSAFLIVGLMLFADFVELVQYWEGKMESETAKSYITGILPLWYVVTLIMLAVAFVWVGIKFQFLKYNEKERAMEEGDRQRCRARLRRIFSFARRE